MKISLKIYCSLVISLALILICIPVMPLSASNVSSYASLSLSKTNFSVIPDMLTSFEVEVINSGTADISNLRFTGGDDSTVGASVEMSDTTIQAGGSVRITLNLQAGTELASGSGQVVLVAHYRVDAIDLNHIFSISVAVGASTATQAPTPPGGSGVAPTSTPQEPEVILKSPSTYVQGQRGVTKSITLTFENISNFNAKDIRVSNVISKDFVVEFVDKENTFSLVKGGTKNVRILVTPDKDLAGGRHQIDIPFRYTSTNGTAKTGTATIFIGLSELATPAPTPTPTPVPSPNLVIDNFSITPLNDIQYGSTFTISGKITNTSSTEAKNAMVAVTGGLTPETLGIPNAAGSVYIGNIAKGASHDFSFTFKASETIATGTYGITFSGTAKDHEENDIKNDYIFSVSVIGDSALDPTPTPIPDSVLAKLDVESISNLSGEYNVGQEFAITIILKNNGEAEAKNIKIEAQETNGIVPKTQSKQQVQSLPVGESVSLTFGFMPTVDTITQNYAIGFQVEYQAGDSYTSDGQTEKVIESFVQYGSVNVTNPEGDKKASGETEKEETKNKSIPKIIVSDYEVRSGNESSPETVMAGEKFDLDLEFKNTHSAKTIYNIKITLSTPTSSTGDRGNTFTPVDSSNTIFIEKIAPGETYFHTIQMYSILQAAAKNHIIQIDFEYEDEEGEQILQKEEVGVNVQQKAKLEIGEIYMPLVAYLNEGNYIYFNFQNTGRVTLYNMKVRLEGEGFDLTGTETVIGNLASGNYNSYDSNFYGTEIGMHKLSIIISYDLDSGERREEVQEFDIEVADLYAGMEGMGMEGMGMEGEMYDSAMMEEEEPQNFFQKAVSFFKGLSVWIYVAVGVALAGIAVTIVSLVIRKKRRKDMDFDEQL